MFWVDVAQFGPRKVVRMDEGTYRVDNAYHAVPDAGVCASTVEEGWLTMNIWIS